jgi:hypothetical protein
MSLIAFTDNVFPASKDIGAYAVHYALYIKNVNAAQY